jgi:hypothetical protein
LKRRPRGRGVTTDPADSGRAREIDAARRSGGDCDLARTPVRVARSEGADRLLQETIAEIVLVSQEPPTEVDIALVMRH